MRSEEEIKRKCKELWCALAKNDEKLKNTKEYINRRILNASSIRIMGKFVALQWVLGEKFPKYKDLSLA